MGNAFSLIPAMDFNVFEYKRLSMQVRIGWGAGVVTKKFDGLTNPANIAMGAHLNACATVRTVFRYRIGENVQLLLGGGITHYSNGGIVIPNLGSNIPFGQVGLQYYFNPSERSDSLRRVVIVGFP